MNRTRFCVALLAWVGLLIGLSAWAEAGISVDGDLGDWGVTNPSNIILTYASGITNNTNPYDTTAGHGKIEDFWGTRTMYYHAEDTGCSYYVGPQYGGQDYDAEFLGAVVYDKLYLGIATGQRPDNGVTYFGPGDIRILTDAGLYGVEVGGGAGSTSRTSGQIVENADGTTYHLIPNNGRTYSSSPTLPTLGDQKAGTLWFDPGWKLDPIDFAMKTQIYQLGEGSEEGTYKGTADYVYNYDSSLGQHAFIELSLDMGLFGTEKIIGVAVAPACGNDVLCVTFPGGAPPPIPEPASVVVWGLLLSLGGCICWWRARRERAG